MIYIMVTKRGSHTLRDYLQDWAGDLASIIEVRLYEDLMRWPAARHGTYIFTDIERLTDEQLAIFRDYAEQLEKQFPEARMLNHPSRALRRLGLTQAMHARGINQFRAFPVTDLPNDIRYPVFLRKEREHQGSSSQLVRHIGGLRLEMAKLAVLGVRMEELLAVEYCETCSPDGWYRKYSAFRFGERILPAHIIFSSHWVAKDGQSPNDALMDEEAAFMRDHPHEPWLRQIFDLAQIQYGRIDYSLIDGRPQVWEINTNPVLLKSRAAYEKTAPKELPVKEKLSLVLVGCFTELDVEMPEIPPPISRDIPLRRFFRMITAPVSPRQG